ncbi:DNA polymerase [Aerococcaceae bacterium INB8]|uniref:DNA-directed DNA polymerase n=1 Tax=Ruoffia halotolerans TaxID=2748684 RepID=A0A839A3G7_9LACT|nr:DNA polymerase [Ruoffia halotolerans]MBA5728547.1 DNA polymerase [Ruoffia halotolerans]
MRTISIDIETFSSVNLSKAGVYKYAESGDFEVLLFAYSIDSGPAQVVDIALGEKLPDEVLKSLEDETIEKWAFNANFERVCLSQFLGYPPGQYLDPSGWYCSMVWSASLGLPLSLEKVGEVLGLECKKMQEGKRLIRYFCTPCKPTKANDYRARNLPDHSLQDWKSFKEYNLRDVEVELAIQHRLSKFPVSSEEWNYYHQDQKINDLGIEVEMDLVEGAIYCGRQTREHHLQEAKDLTGLENPNSPLQLKEWLNQQECPIESMAKKAVKEALETSKGKNKQVLELRQELSKSSVKKYDAMLSVTGLDSRARGLIQFYGANRTGRYAGRLIQVQNLPRNYLTNLKEARNLVKMKDTKSLELLFGSVSNTLSELIRTAFIPKKGHRFIVDDFSSIEARILAWLSKEQWRQEAFKAGKDIYCESASQMFGVPVEKHGVNSYLRQKGKIAELALGYGGSVGALKAMGAIEMGIEEGDLKPLVDAWRHASPNIVDFWWSVDRCTKETVKGRMLTETHGLRFTYESGILFIELPSGRRLAYCKPRIGSNRFGGESVVYEGIGTGNNWQEVESYGAKFVENIVQGIARDILAEAMYRLKDYRVVMHVHDEIVLEVPEGQSSVEEISTIMSKQPEWAQGLELGADGFECHFYQKD